MTEFNFFLDKESKINIVIPDLPQKHNYYYEPTDKLNRFDEVTVTYTGDNFSIVLSKDILNEILHVFNECLKKVIHGKLQLLSTAKTGTLGYTLNNILNEKQDDDISFFWVWSSLNNIDTLFYNIGDEIYLEIVPAYPWTYQEPTAGDGYISFEEFMNNYKPYVVKNISVNTAIQWQRTCEDILKSIDFN